MAKSVSTCYYLAHTTHTNAYAIDYIIISTVSVAIGRKCRLHKHPF